MRAVDCVGALIRDERQRVYVHRRTAERRLLPGIWDIVGGHLEDGETPEQALVREVEEETGWRVREVVMAVTDWEWEYEGRVRRELDYLVTVDGDLSRPRLEAGKHDAGAWVGPEELELLMVGRTDGDRRLRDIVAYAVRMVLSDRLTLMPIAGPGEVLTGHAADLERLHADPWVAEWYGGAWSAEESMRRAGGFQARWEANGVSKWMAFRRSDGSLVGRGGLERWAPDGALVGKVAALLDDGGAWLADRLELGWALLRSARGQGFATELGRAALDHAFGVLGARSVVAVTERHNTASRAVMERLAMRYAGQIRAEGLVEGRPGVHPGAPFAVYVAESHSCSSSNIRERR
ncbi:GNAT family N-acetyltransferase [Kribbella sp. CA-293567]|uniref:GNAT family N-acetyltransferase n=1 Tax=Kribbella sp. CA-293567 TaxID=3002436 RepID=UPI0022DE5CB9|nr:GNAT family N-acetyltransferase [Kribbella sp. CA-293567]WBQ05378.1 GNAT family N-acetyltransferase [Kribbella sp. CA-293567]